MLASNLQPTKNPSVGDVFRAIPSPYSAKPPQEMGHFIREVRKLPRNNTFISLEAAKEESVGGGGKVSLQRWNSVENLTSERQTTREQEEDKIAPIVAVKLEQFNNGSDSNDDDSSETKERNAADRRCSMIPLMAHPAGRPKAVGQPYADREKIVRKKPPLPPKALAKNQDPVRMYRAERLQEKKLDMEQQVDEMREQLASLELSRQKEEQRNREIIDRLKEDISDLKLTCEKLKGAVERLQNADDLFGKMKHEGEFSFYARSYEVSKKILSNTFRRRKANTARPSCLDANGAETNRDTVQSFNDGDQQCMLSDTAGSNSLAVMHPVGVPSGGDGDHNIRRVNSAPPETPVNIVTSMYYVSKIESVGMDGIPSDANEYENPMIQTPEKETMTKKKTKDSPNSVVGSDLVNSRR
uniref:Ams protein n=1 Tax=Anopheles gambiae TaxID=7165 RepID=C7BB98_ANOGA|nr:Ams protein [Anopheles gambiae]